MKFVRSPWQPEFSNSITYVYVKDTDNKSPREKTTSLNGQQSSWYVSQVCTTGIQIRERVKEIKIIFFNQNLYWGFSLESSRRDDSNEYPHHRALRRNKDLEILIHPSPLYRDPCKEWNIFNEKVEFLIVQASLCSVTNEWATDWLINDHHDGGPLRSFTGQLTVKTTEGYAEGL